MSTEKCFCHLNGYKVKDADAREEILRLKQNTEAMGMTIDIHGNQLTNHEGRIIAVEDALNGVGLNIGELESDLDTLNNKVTTNTANIGELESDIRDKTFALEEDIHEIDVRVQSLENGGGGGATLYAHVIKFQNGGDTYNLTLISSNDVAFVDCKAVVTWLNTNGYTSVDTYYPVHGNAGGVSGAGKGVIFGICSPNTYSIKYMCMDAETQTNVDINASASSNFVDRVIQL